MNRTCESKNTIPTRPASPTTCLASATCWASVLPRIRDLADRRLYTAEKAKRYPSLQPFIGGTINLKQLLAHWSEILRLGCSIRMGTVTSSLILRKLASYPRQNALALALRELGRIERTLFTLDWLLDKDLRQRMTAALNKGATTSCPPR